MVLCVCLVCVSIYMSNRLLTYIPICRYITSVCVLDYDTIGATDKFGNVFVLRLPSHITDDKCDTPAGATNRALWEQNNVNGAPNKLEIMAHYHLGEMCTSITLSNLVLGGPKVMLVATVMGGVYAFLPFISKEDADFFTHLEMFMRQERVTLVHRDHLSYRSYYSPVKHVIDGDICELYSSLNSSKQLEMASDVDRTPNEIMKKLEDMRNILM